MRNPLRALGPRWRVARRRHPQAAERIEDLAALGRLGDVRRLTARVAELERDHLLLAAHVATLTEQAARGPAAPGGAPDDEAARQRARLAAVAWYEQRIADLEDRIGVRHARDGGGRASDPRTSGERRGTR